MVKTVHLIRHGHHALLARRLCGRMPGIGLDELGCRQMELCAGLLRSRLTSQPSAIQSSPQRRARESAGILAFQFGLAVEIVFAVDEIDVGDWTGKAFDELNQDGAWVHWNAARGSARPPNGETMRALQRRVVAHLEQLRDDDSESTLLIVSHAEPIRAALLHYLRRPLDDFMSITVDPASVSTLSVSRSRVRISKINQQVPA
jgi:probable phosphoglycerate mutase